MRAFNSPKQYGVESKEGAVSSLMGGAYFAMQAQRYMRVATYFST